MITRHACKHYEIADAYGQGHVTIGETPGRHYILLTVTLGEKNVSVLLNDKQFEALMQTRYQLEILDTAQIAHDIVNAAEEQPQ